MGSDHLREVEKQLQDAYGGECPYCGDNSLNIYAIGVGNTFAVNCMNCENMVVKGTAGNLEFRYPISCECGNEMVYHNGDEGWFCPFCHDE